MEQVIKTPNEVFTFAAKCVTESVFGFNMKEYYSSGAIYPSRVDNPCGTSACIAGDMAYNIEPTSNLRPVSVVRSWVSGGTCKYYESQNIRYVRDAILSLDLVFDSPRVYGKCKLGDITKDEALRLLNKLAGLDKWEEVLVHLEGVVLGYWR